MEIDITKLKSGLVSQILIDQTYSFSKEELAGTDLLALDDVQIEGEIQNGYEDYEIHLNVHGTMILPCAITLEAVSYPFSLQITENWHNFLETRQKSYKKAENSIDILPIIWENILMEIPMKVVSDKAKDIQLEGDGWKLITDDEENNSPFEN